MADLAGLVVAIATAVGVFLALWQIRIAVKQWRTGFEDSLACEFRQIAKEIPTHALLNEDLSDDEFKKALRHLYHYIDLSNEQTFLRSRRRVSREVWKYWCDGIKSNLNRPAFKKAWGQIKQQAPGSFEELRRLENSQFKDDPANWPDDIAVAT